jgi:hypothetical protein
MNNLKVFNDDKIYFCISLSTDDKNNAGIANESRLLSLITLLDGNKPDHNISSQVGSYLDSKLGVDIVAVFNDSCLGFQVKSSYQESIKYTQHHRYKKQETNKGIIYLNGFSKSLDLLYLLSNWLDKPLNHRVVNLIDISNKFRNKQLPIRALNFSSYDERVVNLLGLARKEGRYYKF